MKKHLPAPRATGAEAKGSFACRATFREVLETFDAPRALRKRCLGAGEETREAVRDLVAELADRLGPRPDAGEPAVELLVALGWECQISRLDRAAGGPPLVLFTLTAPAGRRGKGIPASFLVIGDDYRLAAAAALLIAAGRGDRGRWRVRRIRPGRIR